MLKGHNKFENEQNPSNPFGVNFEDIVFNKFRIYPKGTNPAKTGEEKSAQEMLEKPYRNMENYEIEINMYTEERAKEMMNRFSKDKDA